MPTRIRRLVTSAVGSRVALFKSSEEVVARWTAALPAATRSSVLAGYTSATGGIVTDPSLLMIPLDDHGFHRGHCVFDTANVANGRVFGLTMHLNRLLSSARLAKIIGKEPPSAADPAVLRSIILQTIAATGRRDGVFVRYWLSAGRGDFSISPKRCVGPTFYCVVHEDTHSATGERGLSAATVTVPLKPPLLATMKSNNYMLNALVALEAEAAGASMGIQLHEDGHLAESSVATVGVVDRYGWLRTPPPDAILDSTTWARATALAPTLVGSGVIHGCKVAPISRAEIEEARELLSLGGGWVEPIVKLDGRRVGSGGPGPVWLALDRLLREDFGNTELTDEVPYTIRFRSRRKCPWPI